VVEYVLGGGALISLRVGRIKLQELGGKVQGLGVTIRELGFGIRGFGFIGFRV